MHTQSSLPAVMAPPTLKDRIRARIPKALLLIYRLFRTGELFSVISLLRTTTPKASFLSRVRIVAQIYRITYNIPCFHAQSEIIAAIKAILVTPPELEGVVVEAGCCKGGGTAKLSVAAKAAGRELFVFDSFEGIPDNSEPHDKNIWGGRVKFSKGDYCGGLQEVGDNVTKFGNVEVCQFVKGFFENTLPHFGRPVVVAYLDVDLASSTRTCLKYIWPLVALGGILFSQDGHLPLVLDVFNDEEFWRGELNTSRPRVHGCGKSQLIWCRKDVQDVQNAGHPLQHAQRLGRR